MAKIIVSLPPPAVQNDAHTGEFNLFQAGGSLDALPGQFPAGTRYIRTGSTAEIANANNWIMIDILTTKNFTISSNGKLIVMLTTDLSPGNEIPLLGTGGATHTVPALTPSACVGGSNCQSAWTDGRFYSAPITTGTPLRIAFSLDQLCSTPGSSGPLCGGQGGMAYSTIRQTMLSQTIVATVGVVPDSSVNHAKILLPMDSSQPDAQLESQAFNLYVTDLKPITVRSQ